MPRPSAGEPPGIEVRAPEIQLAVRPVLLGRNCPLSRQLAKRVPVNPEVVRCVPRVEPLVVTAALRRRTMIDQCRESLGGALCDLIEHSVEHGVTRACAESVGLLDLARRGP